MKKTEDNSTPVFTVDVKADEHQIQQAVKKLYNTDGPKAGALTRPNGEKAWAPLASEWMLWMLPAKLGHLN
ncbi:60S ribosomal protein L23a [Galemys pyrenaicus]|uniref:60S ribosomal protein L23a n=1 Tax=Galemys pyrenaicus TaxID=202257 RepID=A0A8J6ARI9_GALPY|nr:60S ribosomal protein L23a [Galemys pyrenaicus]